MTDFTGADANGWFQRNKFKLGHSDTDRVMAAIIGNGLTPTTALEIGCANGWRLEAIRERYGASCWGCDLSWDAITQGRNQYKHLNLRVGPADCLGYGSGVFDLVICGFFFYLLPRNQLFTVAAEIDRVLADGGHLIIHDFFSSRCYSREYEHADGLRSYKQNYSGIFLAAGSYSVAGNKIFGTETEEPMSEDDQVCVTVLCKDLVNSWPLEDPSEEEQAVGGLSEGHDHPAV